jgi:ubiquinol-cytochrome c reductase cytochrome b subunit
VTQNIWKWINDRWPLKPLLDLILEEDIPGGARFTYSLGSSVLLVFIIQAITGILQLFYYVPTVQHAYGSLSYLRLEVPFGWLIHGLHYWGAQAMIVLVTFHLSRVFIFGAYKKPREMTWLVGSVLLFLVLAMTFTGSLLPWDMKGYFAAEVGTSIANTVPFVGEFIKKVMRGGDTMGQLTLSRFFIVHIALIPGLIFLLIGIHLISFRKSGSTGPWKEEKRRSKGPFWPNQVVRDMVFATAVFLVLILLAAFIRAPFLGMADPLDTSYQPKPEWNFLFLYQALKAFKGKWEPVGTLGLPLLGFIFFFALPFVDRKRERNPFRRPLAMLVFLIAGVAIILLTLAGNASHPGASLPAETKSAVSKPPASPPTGVSAEGDINRGKALFSSSGCVGCHTVNGTGGKTGPDLSGEGKGGRSAAWLATQIRNPKSHFPNTIMPSFSLLSEQQVGDLVAYLRSLVDSAPQNQTEQGSSTFPSAEEKTAHPGRATQEAPGRGENKEMGSTVSPADLERAAWIVGNPAHGRLLFTKQCQGCHGEKGKGGIPNPGSKEGTIPALNPIDSHLSDPDPRVFVDNIDGFIQNGAVPDGPDPLHRMPDFGASRALTQQQISQIEAYILEINGVERAKISHPGVKPRIFAVIVVVLFGLSAIVLEVIWAARKRGTRIKK